MRPLVCALVLTTLAHAAPRRLGADDGFRVGHQFEMVALSPDGRSFAVGSECGGLHVLDNRTGDPLLTWPESPRVCSLTFDAASQLLVLTPDALRRLRLREALDRLAKP